MGEDGGRKFKSKKKEKTMKIETKSRRRRRRSGGARTCLREMGKVSFPENSGLLTISPHISLHALQTPAQATTCLREGQELSLCSSRLMTSRRSSGGRLAHRLCWTTKELSWNWWTELCDFPRGWPKRMTSKLRRERLPKLSLTSRTMLRSDI